MGHHKQYASCASWRWTNKSCRDKTNVIRDALKFRNLIWAAASAHVFVLAVELLSYLSRLDAHRWSCSSLFGFYLLLRFDRLPVSRLFSACCWRACRVKYIRLSNRVFVGYLFYTARTHLSLSTANNHKAISRTPHRSRTSPFLS